MNTYNIQTDNNLRPIQAQARLLASQTRQAQRNRGLSMLQRAASEIVTEH
jgi:hypothetical protein